MNRKAFNLMLGLLAATVIGIAGCGDGGGSARNNEVTAADASPSQNVIVGNLVKISISSSAADGVFVMQGEGLQGVVGMHISISYDASTLSNPRFAGGPLVEGMISVPNLSNPIQLGIVGSNAIGGSGSGTIGTITFDRTGASPGIITALVVKDLIDAKGNKVTSQPVIINP
jgi:hypothetical protein